METSVVPAWVRGERASRLAIILRAPGCAYDLRPEGGCTYCSFRDLTTKGVPVSSDDLIAQVESALGEYAIRHDRILEIDLYNSGNFLNDDEIPANARRAIIRLCASLPKIKVVLIESRPEYITRPRMEELVSALSRTDAGDGPQPASLEVGIGLECADDRIREHGLKKGFTRGAFERAARVLGESGTGLFSYVMLKPMPMSDQQALASVRDTAEYVHEVAARFGVRARLALEPTFVVPGTPLAEQYAEGKFAPPSLWLTLEAAKSIAALGDLTIGLWDEGLNPIAVPGACADCRDRLVAALRTFNLTQDARALNIPECTCDSSVGFK